jgi:hypothetical protein
LHLFQVIYVDRFSPASRKAAVNEIKVRIAQSFHGVRHVIFGLV